MSYRELEHLAKVSQNQKSFDLGRYFYRNLPDLKNYLFWSHRTDSKGKTNLPVNNAYFAILSQNQKHLQKCLNLIHKALGMSDFSPRGLIGQEIVSNFRIWFKHRLQSDLHTCGTQKTHHANKIDFCACCVRITMCLTTTRCCSSL